MVQDAHHRLVPDVCEGLVSIVGYFNQVLFRDQLESELFKIISKVLGQNLNSKSRSLCRNGPKVVDLDA